MCFYLDKYNQYKWRDTSGSYALSYLCEAAADVVPGTPGDCEGESDGTTVSSGSGCAGSTPDVITCAESYTLFNGGCYKYVTQAAPNYQTAADNCHASSNGWLATLNTQAKLGIVSFFGITQYTYFGLYKSSGCTYSACNSLLRWDTYPGTVAPVGNYTLNMKRYVC